MNAYQQQTGQPISMAQAQAIGLPQAVQSQLITAAALEEQARRIGVAVGDEKVRQTILEAPAFRGPTGSFDRAGTQDRLGLVRLARADATPDDTFPGLLQPAVNPLLAAAPDGSRFVVVNPRPLIQEILDVTKLNTLLHIVDSVDEAAQLAERQG